MKYIARLMIAVLIAAIFMTPAYAGSIRVYAAEKTVKCYASPSSSSEHVVTMGYGESARCVALDGDWAQIKTDDTEAWCRVDGLTTDDPNTGDLTAYVTAGGAKAYALPSSSAYSASVAGGLELTVVALEPGKEWCRVYASGVYAYMRVRDLTTDAPGAEEAADESGAEKSVTVYIDDETVSIYTAPASSSVRAATASYGEKAVCTALDGSWAQIEYGDITGWCYKSKLSADDPNTGDLTVYAKKAGTSVYAQPSDSGTAICTIGTTTALKCVAVTPDGSWLRVTASGKYGYVKKSQMTTEKSDSRIDELIDLAIAQLGKPYIYATRGTSSYDCAGLTLYCFREVYGITLGRSAQSQGYNEKYDKIEAVSDVRKGDIVCFNTVEDDADLTDHVGICIGDGKFIHASSAKGEVVISSYTTGYYNRVFSWARRLAD